MNTLLILVTQGVAVSFFPIFSERAASNDMEGVKRALYSGIEVLTFVIAPIAAALVIFGKPAIQMLLERGAFTYEATIGTNTAVLCYLGYLFAGAIGSIQTYVFYSLQDTSAIFKVTAITLLPQIALSLFLSHALGFVGLALSLSVIAVINMLLFAAMLHQRLKGIAVKRMVRSQIKIWFSGFAMAVVSLGMDLLLSRAVEGIGEGFAIRAAALIVSAAQALPVSYA